MMIPGISRRISGLWVTLLALAMALALAACSSEATPTPTPIPGQSTTAPQPTPTPGQPTTAPQPTPTAVPAPAVEPTILSVVTTTSIVADWVENIGGDRVEVFSLVPRGADPHGYQPGARDAARVADADLVLTVGLGLEESWLNELIQNVSADESSIVVLGNAIDPIEFSEPHADDHADDHAELDEQFLEELRHVLHEVEDGDITVEEGLKEIEELLENFKHHAEGEEPQGPADLVHELLLQFVRGEIDAEKAIEEMEHIAEGEEGHEGHDHDGDFLEELSDILHEVEDGHITAEQGLEEIEELLEGMDHHGEQEEAVHEIVHQFEDGQIDAEKAIEEIEHIAEGEDMHDDHGHEAEFLEELSDILHEVEDGHITAEQGLEEIEELLEGMDHHGEQEEAVHEIVHQFEDGQIDAEKAIEEIEHIAEGEDMHDDHGHEGHDHGPLDPHFWFDPIRVKAAVIEIATQLATIDMAGVQTYTANATAYVAQLEELHAWTQQQVAMVPEDRRLLVTSHDSLGYFAQLYGFTVVGVILGTTTEVEPSAQDLAELIHEVEELGVPAIFGETTVSERLANTVATESGAQLVRLYSGSLDDQGTDAGTYIGMVRANVERIVEALN